MRPRKRSRTTLGPIEDPRRQRLIAGRPKSADEVAEWAQVIHGENGQNGRDRRDGQPEGRAVLKEDGVSIGSISSVSYAEIAANGAHALIGVACSLLDRQVAALAQAFENEGGFTERLYKTRKARRTQ